jgi:hypothetical protein
MNRQRNDSLFDPWSIVHIMTGVLFAWVMPPFVALSIMVLWEPLEILVLSPLLARFNINFGYETIRNSLSDICFDVLGVALGVYVLSNLASPPFHIF